MSGPGFIYLASRSTRRRELLAQIGIPYQVFLLREDPRRGIDIEEARLPDESPRAYVMRLAKAKAAVAWQKVPARGLPRAPVLGAHTSVVLGDETLGKPSSVDDAVDMLERLSGRTHQVLTAVAIVQGDRIETALSSSKVEFRQLSSAEIHRYVDTGEPFNKAGGYAIEAKAAVFVRRIQGSYPAIMGLPLFETTELLRHFGIDVLSLRTRSRV